MNKILVGLDGSSNSFLALEKAINLAKLNKAELHTISVEEIPNFSETISEIEDEKESGEKKFKDILEKAKKMAVQRDQALETHVMAGHQVKVILEFIKKNQIDLLVVGFVGHSAIFERVMGSTSLSLVRLAECSVLVVKYKKTAHITENEYPIY